MFQKRLLFIIIILLSVIIYLSVQCVLMYLELKSVREQIVYQQTNKKVVLFANLFINKILLSTGTIEFEDRLKLENAVRELNDPQIFQQWQNLTASQGDAQTQKIVGTMLKMLINMIK